MVAFLHTESIQISTKAIKVLRTEIRQKEPLDPLYSPKRNIFSPKIFTVDLEFQKLNLHQHNRFRLFSRFSL